MKILKVTLLLILVVALFAVHGYWYATSVIDKYVQRCGAYATLDEAIEADMRHNGYDLAWFEMSKSPNRETIPFTWYIIYTVKPEHQAAYDQVPPPAQWCGGSFYEHTRYGWVGMPEHIFNAIGYLDTWMNVYHLYGESG